MPKLIYHLFTPGLDSFLSYPLILKKHQQDTIVKLYFNIHSRYSNNELNFFYKYFKEEQIPVISHMFNLENIEKEDAYIPNRNLLFCAGAASLGADIIYLNGVKDDRSPDQNKDFYRLASDTLSCSLKRPISIKSILINREKSAWVIKYYLENRGKEELLDLLTKTYSCYHDEFVISPIMVYYRSSKTGNAKYEVLRKINVVGCRNCSACYRKFVALTNADIFVPFNNKEIIQHYMTSSDYDVYTERIKSIKRYNSFLEWYEKEHPK